MRFLAFARNDKTKEHWFVHYYTNELTDNKTLFCHSESKIDARRGQSQPCVRNLSFHVLEMLHFVPA